MTQNEPNTSEGSTGSLKLSSGDESNSQTALPIVASTLEFIAKPSLSTDQTEILDRLPSENQILNRDIPIDDISVPRRLRQIKEDAIHDMMESVARLGILQPLTVRPVGNSQFELVAGLHRWEAARRLGLTKIPCRVLYADDLQAELVEIDENLIRRALTDAEWTAHIYRRHEIYESLHGSAKARGAHAANSVLGRHASANLAPAFTSGAATLTGKSGRTIQRAVSRGGRLGIESLRAVAGTSLDKGAELEALCELAEADRATLMAQAAAGVRVSAVQIKRQNAETLVKRRPGASHATPYPESAINTDFTSEFEALMRAWERASSRARQMFIEAVGPLG